MSSIYSEFAFVYDALTDDIDYKETVGYLEKIFEKQMNCKPKLILELACGTGSVTSLLAEKGYDMIGADLSEDMLNIAREKCDQSVLLLNQDMTDFELYGTVDVILCLLDSVNYVTDKKKLQKMFSLAHNYLEYGGLFIFDINSSYKLKNIIAENTFIRETEDIYSVWENEQDGESVKFCLNFFVKNENNSYERFCEEHKERIYEIDEVLKMLKKAGFEDVKVYGNNTFKPPSEKEERIYFIAKRQA